MSTGETKPKRIQRKRTKGWKMPPNTVYVGRPGYWGNLWKVGVVRCGCRSAGECSHNTFNVETPIEAVEMYRWWIMSGQKRQLEAQKLRGYDLACWCPLDQPCHADVLLEIANSEAGDGN